MKNIEEILKFNQEFVFKKEYVNYTSSKYPNKKMAIVSCMDTRLTELLPNALNIKNGDVKIIKNAGALIIHPFGSVMRSLLIAIYNLDVEDILIIGHEDCGMQNFSSEDILEKMKQKNVENNIALIEYCGIDLKSWFQGFKCADESVKNSVNLVKNHPLVPKNINVYGFLIDSTTGELTPVK